MIKLLAFIFTLIASQALLGFEFKSFGLKNELKELNELEEGTFPRAFKSFEAARESRPKKTELQERVSQKLLGLSPRKIESAQEAEVSPLIQKIAEALAGNYDQIGREQTGSLVLNHDIGGGVLNFSGFTWQRPFANFRLYVHRQLAPDLFSDLWIVHDTLVVGIDASTLLTNLKDADLIDIAEEGIGAFAGVGFTREYQYYHFADTFLDGLQKDYSKLFLSFAKFNRGHVLNMPPYQVMKLKDKFSFNAGGMVNIPSGGGLSGRAGVLVSVAHQRGLTLQSLGENDSPKAGEFLRLGVESKTDVSVGGHVSLQADFFNLLKLTLLSYDLEYSYGRSNTTHLSFYEPDKEKIEESSAHRREFEKLIKGRSDEPLEFRKNIVGLEERINQNLNSKYSVLLFGSVKKRETEQIKIVKNGIEKVFFKHYAESVKFVQNLWSRIYGVVIRKLFDWDTGIRNAAEIKKKLSIEFEHMADLGEAKVDGADKFSLTLSQNFQAAKTHRWWHWLYRKETRKHLAKMTNLGRKYRDLVDDRDLRGPLEISSKVSIQETGLQHFNFLDEKTAFKMFKEVCDSGRSCQKMLRRKYTSYTGHFHRYGIVDLMRFKSFIGSYFKRIRHYSDLYPLFGKDNIFINGAFKARTREGSDFATYFKEGEFQGLGVIDTFMREGVNRAPANISAK